MEIQTRRGPGPPFICLRHRIHLSHPGTQKIEHSKCKIADINKNETTIKNLAMPIKGFL